MNRRLDAARIVGANTFATFALVAIDMPQGYFGPADALTFWGAVYLGWLGLVTGASLWGLYREKAWGTFLIWLSLSVNIGVFVAALTTGPLMAALTIIWNLSLLSWMLFPFRGHRKALRTQIIPAIDEDPLKEWLQNNGPALRHLLLVSLILNLAIFGYRLSAQWIAMTGALTLAGATVLLSVSPLWKMIKTGRTLIVLIAIPLILMAFFVGDPQILLLLVSFFQLTALLIFLFRTPIVDNILDFFFEYPALMVLATFASLILLGTLLLSLPAASATGEPLNALDVFFTATSAACITGLLVLEIPATFSTFGHVVILILIQLGGLGIIVLSTFSAILLGNKIGLRAEYAVEEALELGGAKTTYELTIFITLSTLLIEAVGAAFLVFPFLGLGFDLPRAIWHGVFHSVSAFCNAGIALHSQSMVIFQDDPFALTILSTLAAMGSVGFLVLAIGWQGIRGVRPRLSVQVKIILITSAVLIGLGTMLFLICEWNASMAGMSASERIFNALLQSVILRSAGYNSLDTTIFTGATLWFAIGFMIIGGAPGSTAGGIKVTTLVVLMLAVRGIAAGRPRVVIFGREIPQEVVYRSAGIVILYLLIIFLLLFLLLLTQPLAFEVLAFEAVSALGTVGLSLGATASLNEIGKVFIATVMFIGRVGPLALALVLGRGSPSRLRYPQERIMVG